MRENILEIPCNKGLRKDFRASRNTLGFTRLLNVEVHGSDKTAYLAPYNAVVNPIDPNLIVGFGITADWPHPQLIKGMKYDFLAASQGLYLVSEEDWQIYYLHTYDFSSQSDEKAITKGGLWQIADFGDFWMAVNGACAAFKYGTEEKVYVVDTTSIETVCNYKGRLLMGGFDKNKFWSSTWQTNLESWAGESDVDLTINIDVDPNVVWYSKVGGGNAFWLWETPSTDHLEDMETLDTGFTSMEWGGKVRNIIPLGDFAIVYGDDGITALKSVVEPAPALAQRTLMRSLGIANPGAVGGCHERHVFVDPSGQLWSVDSNLNVEKLGYREFFYPLLGTVIRVNYSEDERKFYIGNDDQMFVLTEAGLTETDHFVTSAFAARGATVGFCSTPHEGLFILETDVFDMGYRAIKHLHAVSAACTADRSLYCRVHYRFDKSAAFSQTEWRELNKEGWAVMSISGIEFKVELKGEPYYDFEPPDYINIRWNAVDNRNRRR